MIHRFRVCAAAALVLTLVAGCSGAAPGEPGEEETDGEAEPICVATMLDGEESAECPGDPNALMAAECTLFGTKTATYFTNLCASWGYTRGWSANSFSTQNGGCWHVLNECY